MRKLTYEIIIGEREIRKANKGVEEFPDYFQKQILRMLKQRLDMSSDPLIQCKLIEYSSIESVV